MSSQIDQNQHDQNTSPSMDILVRRGKSRYSKWKSTDSTEDTSLKDDNTKNEEESFILSYRNQHQNEAKVPIKLIICNKLKKQIYNIKMLLQDMDSVSSATISSISSISTQYDSDNSVTKKCKHDNRPKLHFRKVPKPILKKTDNKLILLWRIMCDLDTVTATQQTTRNTSPKEKNGLSLKHNRSIKGNNDLDKKVHGSSESNETSSSEEDSFMKELNRRQKRSDEEWDIFMQEMNYSLNTKDGS